MIVDAPPLNPVADTQALLDSPAIHATLIVGRVNQTTRDEVQRARAILDLHMVNPIGIVVTGLARRELLRLQQLRRGAARARRRPRR